MNKNMIRLQIAVQLRDIVMGTVDMHFIENMIWSPSFIYLMYSNELRHNLGCLSSIGPNFK